MDAVKGWLKSRRRLFYAGLLPDTGALISGIRKSANDGLCQLGLRLALLCLGESVQVSDVAIRQEVLDAALIVRGKGKPPTGSWVTSNEAVEYLLLWVKTGPWHANAAVASARSLFDRGEVTALVEALELALDNPEAVVREAVLIAIADWPGEEPPAVLFDRVQNHLSHDDAAVRSAAVSALTRYEQSRPLEAADGYLKVAGASYESPLVATPTAGLLRLASRLSLIEPTAADIVRMPIWSGDSLAWASYLLTTREPASAQVARFVQDLQKEAALEALRAKFGPSGLVEATLEAAALALADAKGAGYAVINMMTVLTQCGPRELADARAAERIAALLSQSPTSVRKAILQTLIVLARAGHESDVLDIARAMVKVRDDGLGLYGLALIERISQQENPPGPTWQLVHEKLSDSTTSVRAAAVRAAAAIVPVQLAGELASSLMETAAARELDLSRSAYKALHSLASRRVLPEPTSQALVKLLVARRASARDAAVAVLSQLPLVTLGESTVDAIFSALMRRQMIYRVMPYIQRADVLLRAFVSKTHVSQCMRGSAWNAMASNGKAERVMTHFLGSMRQHQRQRPQLAFRRSLRFGDDVTRVEWMDRLHRDSTYLDLATGWDDYPWGYVFRTAGTSLPDSWLESALAVELGADDEEVRFWALGLLDEIGCKLTSEATVGVLLASMESASAAEHTMAVQRALQLIAPVHHATVLAAVRRRLVDPDPEQREAAWNVLADTAVAHT